VIEIGPGPGGLTRAILQAGAREVIAVEKDERAMPVLQELAGHAAGRLRAELADATTLNPTDYGTPPRAIIANLPYNVGTDMLTGWLNHIANDASVLDRLLLMFQLEVVQRLVAQPGSKSYGRLSVLTQWLCEAHLVMVVPPEAFTPPPKVDSGVVLLVPRKAPLVPCRKERLEKLVSLAFSQRRKMLRATLKPLGPEVMDYLPQLGIDPQMRAENVTVEQFAQLALRLDEAGHKGV
jgi:16S rRNA (adenine1518-N6/adenine1519-N6)-dimethyltransferase